MTPYEALYGHKCHTPLCWTELGERRVLGLELVFETEDKVSPWKKILMFGCKGKLSPRFIGSYRILKRVGPVSYQLELPPELDQKIEVRPDLTFEEESIQDLNRDVKVMRRKPIPLVKVLWRNHSTEGVTWELEDAMC
ncbi:uncharacterized protein LOC108462045 [Gossypium arboreum]|uniref:uncharacterized protein LOC108462045 n=1 Tax=Gossypium arboreum TaxID=29729 RepID=UPI0008194E55|nr:uncharacterized protein LOC108462045 [Gossypium arboreum]